MKNSVFTLVTFLFLHGVCKAQFTAFDTIVLDVKIVSYKEKDCYGGVHLIDCNKGFFVFREEDKVSKRKVSWNKLSSMREAKPYLIVFPTGSHLYSTVKDSSLAFGVDFAKFDWEKVKPLLPNPKSFWAQNKLYYYQLKICKVKCLKVNLTRRQLLQFFPYSLSSDMSLEGFPVYIIYDVLNVK